MPNALSHIVFKVEVEPLGLITIDILVAPNGDLSVTYDSNPAASTYSPDKPAGGPPIVRTVNLSLNVARDANGASSIKLEEVVALVQGVAAVLQPARSED
ncbi:hypothetical protein FA95DRAFT_1605105 [Auriscalpium vulgare]|uniref:Uncharacterized protein n=1 Tax=Auriscalpium vulgare TaxID=40419 RepID=A0ACB8RYB1_9AGAM|nr:hypothetical protein FA95DRAFT_1605105 [Auriscalpium vulgare]